MSMRNTSGCVLAAVVAAMGTLAGGPLAGECLGQMCRTALAPVRFPAAPGTISAITRFDDDADGTPSFFIAGPFGVRRLDGGAWVGVGTTSPGDSRVFAVLDVAGVPRLHVGGANGVYRLQDGNWTRLGGPSFAVHSMVVHDDGGGAGPTIYAGSRSASVVTRLTWDSAWVPVGAIGNQVTGSTALAVYDDDGAGPSPARLFAVGAGLRIGNAGALLARWNGSAWSSITQGVSPNSYGAWVNSVAVVRSAAGDRLVLSSHPTFAAPFSAGSTTMWDGSAFATYARSLSNLDTFYGMAGFEENRGGPEVVYGLYAQGLVRVSPDVSAGSPFTVASPVSFSPSDTSYGQRQMLSVPAGVGPGGDRPALLYFPGSTGISGSPIGVLVGCPRLVSDFNVDGVVGVDDIFGFLQYFFTASPFADADGSGTVNVTDLLAFLSRWFART